MAYYKGYTDNSGGLYANQNFFNFAVAKLNENGWVTLRLDKTKPVWEVILKGSGLSGTDEIYIGLRCFQNVGSDVYNLSVAGFSGYIPSNTFETQPKYYECTVCGHNLRMDYWVMINKQRMAFCLKVGTPVYESGYVGKVFPYATPAQYGYPLLVAGSIKGLAYTRYSGTARTFPWYGNHARMGLLFVDGTYKIPYGYPLGQNPYPVIRDSAGMYVLSKIQLVDTAQGYFGEVDGVFGVTGFNNVVENIIKHNGIDYLVVQDIYRTGIGNYVALRLT